MGPVRLLDDHERILGPQLAPGSLGLGTEANQDQAPQLRSPDVGVGVREAVVEVPRPLRVEEEVMGVPWAVLVGMGYRHERGQVAGEEGLVDRYDGRPLLATQGSAAPEADVRPAEV